MYHDTWMRDDRMNDNERTLKLNEMAMPLLDDQFIMNLQTKYAVANSAISFEYRGVVTAMGIVSSGVYTKTHLHGSFSSRLWRQEN